MTASWARTDDHGESLRPLEVPVRDGKEWFHSLRSQLDVIAATAGGHLAVLGSLDSPCAWSASPSVRVTLQGRRPIPSVERLEPSLTIHELAASPPTLSKEDANPSRCCAIDAIVRGLGARGRPRVRQVMCKMTQQDSLGRWRSPTWRDLLTDARGVHRCTGWSQLTRWGKARRTTIADDDAPDTSPAAAPIRPR
jgi:hypothetical protein